MLADPGLVVAEVVEPLDQFQVAAQRQGRVVAHAMEWGKENAEAQALMRRHAVVLSNVPADGGRRGWVGQDRR